MLLKKITLSLLSLAVAIPGLVTANPIKNRETRWGKFASAVAQHQGNYILPTVGIVAAATSLGYFVAYKKEGLTSLNALGEGLGRGLLAGGTTLVPLFSADFLITESLD